MLAAVQGNGGVEEEEEEEEGQGLKIAEIVKDTAVSTGGGVSGPTVQVICFIFLLAAPLVSSIWM